MKEFTSVDELKNFVEQFAIDNQSADFLLLIMACHGDKSDNLKPWLQKEENVPVKDLLVWMNSAKPIQPKVSMISSFFHFSTPWYIKSCIILAPQRFNPFIFHMCIG